MSATGPGPAPGAPHCYAHPDRVAGSVCRRCGRPICPDCMREAPVGWQCTACVKQGARISPTIRWRPRPAGRLGNTRMTPMVLAVIVANVVVFLWEETKFDNITSRFALWPIGVHYDHQWYRLITAAFLHASVEHIGLNMITLAIVGPPVEAEIGKLRFGALYLLSALGGSVASYLLSSANVLGLGASGAIFGVMGAYYVLARIRRWDVSQITVLVVLNLVLGFASTGIDWRAHLGGLVVGAAACFGFMADPGRLGRRRPAPPPAAGAWVPPAPGGAGQPWGPPGGAGQPWAPPAPPPSAAAGPSRVDRLRHLPLGAATGSPTAQAVQALAVTIALVVVLALLAQLPPGHVNLS